MKSKAYKLIWKGVIVAEGSKGAMKKFLKQCWGDPSEQAAGFRPFIGLDPSKNIGDKWQ